MSMSKETPCVAVCMIDPKTRLCFGCGRTLPEIRDVAGHANVSITSGYLVDHYHHNRQCPPLSNVLTKRFT